MTLQESVSVDDSFADIESAALQKIANRLGVSGSFELVDDATNRCYGNRDFVVKVERVPGTGRIEHAVRVQQVVPPGVDAFDLVDVGDVFGYSYLVMRKRRGLACDHLLRTDFAKHAATFVSAAATALEELHQVVATVEEWPSLPPSGVSLPGRDWYTGLNPDVFDEEIKQLFARGRIDKKTFVALDEQHRYLSSLVGCETVPLHGDCSQANWWSIDNTFAGLFDWEFARRGPAVMDTFSVIDNLLYFTNQSEAELADALPSYVMLDFLRRSSGLDPHTALLNCELLLIIYWIGVLAKSSEPCFVLPAWHRFGVHQVERAAVGVAAIARGERPYETLSRALKL